MIDLVDGARARLRSCQHPAHRARTRDTARASRGAHGIPHRPGGPDQLASPRSRCGGRRRARLRRHRAPCACPGQRSRAVTRWRGHGPARPARHARAGRHGWWRVRVESRKHGRLSRRGDPSGRSGGRRDPCPGGRRPGGGAGRLRRTARDTIRLRRGRHGAGRRRSRAAVQCGASRRRPDGCADARHGRYRGDPTDHRAPGRRPRGPDADDVRPRRVRLRRTRAGSEWFSAQGRDGRAPVRRRPCGRGRRGPARSRRDPAAHRRVRPAAPSARSGVLAGR